MILSASLFGHPYVAGSLVLDAAQLTPLIVAAPAGAIDTAPYLSPIGQGFDGVAKLTLFRTDGTFLCSGALIGPSAVLTAAHCLTDSSGVNRVSSLSVEFTTADGIVTRQGETSAAHPEWAGSIGSIYDVAVVQLSAPAGPYVDIYDLYSGPLPYDEVVALAGYGRRGSGATGANLSSGMRRQGTNQFELTLDGALLLSDFDNGLKKNDSFCRDLGMCPPHFAGTGTTYEANIAPGDSGGPALLNGQLVGIASFGLRLHNSTADVDDTLNFSAGELAGHIYAPAHADWIYSFLNVETVPYQGPVVPEPSTWLLMISGAVVLGFVRVRSRY
jgi:hypothetical protein